MLSKVKLNIFFCFLLSWYMWYLIKHLGIELGHEDVLGPFPEIEREREREREREFWLCIFWSASSLNISNYSYFKVTVGIGRFHKGHLNRILSNNKASVGGVVMVGPFLKDALSAKDILAAAVHKFKFENRHFDETKEYGLFYHDGRPVKDIPDGSTEFTLRGYKTFKGVSYDRLRLYLAEVGEYFGTVIFFATTLYTFQSLRSCNANINP